MALERERGTDGTRGQMALCITHAEPELTARPWFRVLNSHQGQSAYSGTRFFGGYLDFGRKRGKSEMKLK